MSDKTVDQILRDGADTFAQRNKLYGDSYKKFGDTMASLFPDGVSIKSPEQWARMGVYVMLVSKVSRYSQNLAAGGHFDSALDASVYSAMLAELTKENDHE